MNTRLTSEMGSESKAIAKKATYLIGELLHLANTLLPPSQCAKLQALPSLVQDAITFTVDPRLRSLAGTSVTILNKYSHMKRTDLNPTNSSKLDYFEEVKKKLEWKLDESVLKAKLNESVLLKRDHTLWNWDMITELIEGPLANPTHFNSPMGKQFIKALLSFFQPGKKIFPMLPLNRVCI
jgi:rapamycin-insensitive companion of mTOR